MLEGWYKIVRLVASMAMMLWGAVAFAQQTVAVPSVDAELGPCVANFQVTDEAGKPISGAKIHASIPSHLFRDGRFMVKVYYADVSTNSEGKARVIRLPRYPMKGVSGANGETREVLESFIPHTVVFQITHDKVGRSLEFEPKPGPGNCEGDFRVALGKAESATSGTEAKQSNDQAVALTDAAESLARMGESQKALDQCKQIEAIAAADAAICYCKIGAVLAMYGKGDDANAAFDRSIQVNPQYAEAYYRKAITLMGKATLNKDGTMNALPEVAQNLNKYLELAPSGPNVEAAKQKLASLGAKGETSYGEQRK